MRHIESSKLIRLSAATDIAAIKYSLVERLRGALHVETVGEGNESFTITAMGKDSPCRCTLNVVLRSDGNRARIMVDGSVFVSTPTKILYTLGIIVLLVIGRFPGTINTAGNGTAMDVMVFLFLGMFIIYDINKKLAAPGHLVDRVLTTVETELSE